MTHSAIEAKLRASFKRQRLMQTIGASLSSIAPGCVEVELPFDDRLVQQHNYLHAAAVTAIADTAGGYAALTLMEPEDEVVAVEFKINLVRPAKGDRFVARGEVVKSGRSLSVCSVRVVSVTGDHEEVIAVMTQTCMRVRP